MIKFSIGICTYNRSDMLMTCLRALEKHLSHRYDYEIIVINNNSSDNTSKMLDRVDFVDHYLELNQGLSYARNRLIEESCGEYILFLDDDAIICSDILESYSSAIKSFPNKKIFGGKVVPELDVVIPSWFDKNFHMAYSILDLGDGTHSFTKPNGPIGANFLVKKSAIGNVTFRTDLGRVGDLLLSGEETDFIVNLGGAKDCIYVGSAVVYHHFEHKRYDFDWARERFKQNGISDYLLRKEKNNTFKGLASQIYHFSRSITAKNINYTKCRYYSLLSYFRSF
ncbi:glycosyltransferase [Vibrio crassostreae]|uniref:glycosyltransferase n=1 Tax=Vibrio crassostreae TaxID=246167 RepID=UPI001B308635|nr:glycosyltransferase [Vibrio crassostreae]